jgi:hypothetical protein
MQYGGSWSMNRLRDRLSAASSRWVGSLTRWTWTDQTKWKDEMMASQGYVGQTAEGQVVLQDADPRTEGATYDTVAFSAEDDVVAAVASHPDDPLRCTVLLLAPGTTRVLCVVDPGEGEPLNFAADVESLAPVPGEAVGGTFTLGEFVEVPPA